MYDTKLFLIDVMSAAVITTAIFTGRVFVDTVSKVNERDRAYSSEIQVEEFIPDTINYRLTPIGAYQLYDIPSRKE